MSVADNRLKNLTTGKEYPLNPLGDIGIGYPHHLVGNAVCFLLIFIVGLANGELGLRSGGAENISNLCLLTAVNRGVGYRKRMCGMGAGLSLEGRYYVMLRLWTLPRCHSLHFRTKT